MFDNLVEGIMEKVTRKRKVRSDAEPVEMTVVRDETKDESPIEPVVEEKERPKAKVWKKQPNVVVDLHPTVSISLKGLQSEQEELTKMFEKNLFAIRRIKKGVLDYYGVAVSNLDLAKVIVSEEGTFQLDIPQSDILKEDVPSE